MERYFKTFVTIFFTVFLHNCTYSFRALIQSKLAMTMPVAALREDGRAYFFKNFPYKVSSIYI